LCAAAAKPTRLPDDQSARGSAASGSAPSCAAAARCATRPLPAPPPQLLDDPRAAEIFPTDALERARKYLAGIPGGTGAYSESKGARILREDVAAGIAERDGFPCSADDLWLTDGASVAVHYLMRVLLRDEGDAVLTPIPQYPLYSATITLYGARRRAPSASSSGGQTACTAAVAQPQLPPALRPPTANCAHPAGGSLLPYYLSEEKGWQTSVEHLTAQVQSARAEGKHVRAMVVINPGNPTGQVLDRSNQEDIVKFCKKVRCRAWCVCGGGGGGEGLFGAYLAGEQACPGGGLAHGGWGCQHADWPRLPCLFALLHRRGWC
jgi:DNA-binding transcriptional MocR family regulator